jgi:thioredoxin-related protein
MNKLFIYLSLIFTLNLSASEIEWVKDYKTAVAKASKTNKPIMLVSSSYSCKYCEKLEETTFKDKKIIEKLNKDFISVITYNAKKDSVPKKLWHPGTPATFFLFSDGEPMYQPLLGAIKPHKFLKAITITKKKFDKVSGKL